MRGRRLRLPLAPAAQVRLLRVRTAEGAGADADQRMVEHELDPVRDELRPAAGRVREPGLAEDAVARLRLAVEEADALVVVHPLGSLSVRQRVLPLAMRIDRFGGAPVALGSRYLDVVLGDARSARDLDEQFAIALNNGDADAWKNGQWGKAFASISKNMRYRSGWYLVDDQPKTMFAMGIHGQNLFIDRANRIVIAKLSSRSNRIDYQALPLTHRAVPEFRRLIAARIDRADRTARSGSSSWATGAPNSAITASPMNFSSVPP